VGTSFTVPLNPNIVSKVSKNARKYSVSGDDLERSDLSLSPSHPVYSYSAPVNNLDTYVAPGTAGVDVAEARDGAGGHHHHHHAEHAGQAPAAPAASFQQPAAETSYQEPVSTGNLYYYYYPVAAYPLDEKNDSDELDPLVLVLLPVTVLVGLLALLSIFNVSVTGRSFQGKSESVYGSVDQLKAKVDNLLENYYLALESESCMDRVVCELGTQATNLSGKTLLLSALDWFTPAPMQERIEIFKEAANEGYPVHVCKSKYYCHSQNLIETRRK